MSPRERLPNRRRAETIDISHNSQRLTLTVGFDDDNHVAEVFVTASKAGSETEATARDAAIQISVALQNGILLESQDHSLTINPDGTPSSLIGAVVKAMLNWPEPLTFVLKPDEVVPAALRSLHRWGPRHDKMAKRVMDKFGWKLPDDRERIYRETWLRIRPHTLYHDPVRSIAEVDAADIGEPLTHEP